MLDVVVRMVSVGRANVTWSATFHCFLCVWSLGSNRFESVLFGLNVLVPAFELYLLPEDFGMSDDESYWDISGCPFPRDEVRCERFGIEISIRYRRNLFVRLNCFYQWSFEKNRLGTLLWEVLLTKHFQSRYPLHNPEWFLVWLDVTKSMVIESQRIGKAIALVDDVGRV